MNIKFSKMHGMGNDFMVIDATEKALPLDPDTIRRWADRHLGVGFDQLLLVETTQHPQADFDYRIFNADGYEVEQCGNGARCIAYFIHRMGLSAKNPLIVATKAGLLALYDSVDETKKSALFSIVTVNMGQPVFKSMGGQPQRAVPTISTVLGDYRFFELSLGNPHAVLQVDSVDDAPVATLGPLIEKHEYFPNGVNVGFMQVIDRQSIRLRVFERGAGETQACGSGACAAMVAGRQLGLLESKVSVCQPGGILTVEWQGFGDPVYLTGPAQHVFEGVISLGDTA